MKTLNEVIEKIEKMWVCPSSDEAAEYCDFMEVKEDALHYLKVLQKIQKAQPVTKGEWDELYNEPLTWDELRQMEGKPVWFEYDNHLSGRKRIKYKDWEVIDMIEEDLIHVKGDYSYQKDEFGDIWQAYQKERG